MTTPDPNRPAPRSSRLDAEPVEESHAARMVALLADPELYRYLNGAPPTIEELRDRYRFLSGGRSPDGSEVWLTWILVERASGEPVGFTQASVREGDGFDVAYVIGREHQRRGYAREAVTAMIDAVFERYDVDLAVIECDTRNEASIGLAERLGFRLVDTRATNAHPAEAAIVDHVYHLARDEWRSR